MAHAFVYIYHLCPVDPWKIFSLYPTYLYSNLPQLDIVSFFRRPTARNRINAQLASESLEDVVCCVCVDTADEGFMIQCEKCLCWQHGICVDITNDTLPASYVCHFCHLGERVELTTQDTDDREHPAQPERDPPARH